MIWLIRAVNGERRILEEAEEILESSFEADTQIALSDLRGVLELDERSKGPIFSTTANAFAAYRLPGAIASTKKVNFDPADFAAGDPEAFNPLRVADPNGEDNPDENTMLEWGLGPKGRYQHRLHHGQFRTAKPRGADRGQLVQPDSEKPPSPGTGATRQRLLRSAASALGPGRSCGDRANGGPARDAQPVGRPRALGGGVPTGPFSMARARWDKAADAFLTLFGNIVIHPGIRDDATLKAISTVIGKQWVTVTSEGTTQNTGRDRQGRNSSDGYTYYSTEQQIDRLDPGAIAQGRVMEHPHFVLGLTPDGWDWFFATPYYSVPPWVQLLVGTMEYAAWSGDILERVWELPVPILDRDHDGRLLAGADVTGVQLVERYRQAVADLKQMTHVRRETLARLGNDSLLAGYDDSWSSRLPGPQLSYIALGHNVAEGQGFQHGGSAPDLTAIARTLEALSEVRRAGPDEEVVITSNTADTGRWTPMADLPTTAYPQAGLDGHLRRASHGTYAPRCALWPRPRSPRRHRSPGGEARSKAPPC